MIVAMTEPAMQSKGAALVSTDPTLVYRNSSHKSDLDDFESNAASAPNSCSGLKLPEVQQQDRTRNWKNNQRAAEGLGFGLKVYVCR